MPSNQQIRDVAGDRLECAREHVTFDAVAPNTPNEKQMSTRLDGLFADGSSHTGGFLMLFVVLCWAGWLSTCICVHPRIARAPSDYVKFHFHNYSCGWQSLEWLLCTCVRYMYENVFMFEVQRIAAS